MLPRRRLTAARGGQRPELEDRTLDGSLTGRLVRDMIEDSYDLAVSALPKRVQAQLDWPPAESPA